MSIDKGLSKYDPHKIAEAKMEAIKNYREAKRDFNSLIRQKDEKEKTKYLHYRFLHNDKHSVEDAKAKARTDDEVTDLNILLDDAEELMDKMFAELDRITTKIELMSDANATMRAEMKLGGLTP
jgi:hypothetical protein